MTKYIGMRDRNNTKENLWNATAVNFEVKFITLCTFFKKIYNSQLNKIHI